ncbi:hypothetical protein [Streptomyces chumphonensis]|uniref:hypothetical protein n=1 Tax=Streptomyces chumphonensis TaxID=1214925 RepID=UPI003D70951C
MDDSTATGRTGAGTPTTGPARTRGTTRAGRATALVGAALVLAGAAVALTAFPAGLIGPDAPAPPAVSPPDGRAPSVTPVTAEAEAALRRLKRAGLPVEGYRSLTRGSDPDRLLGRADGYRSKLTFEDRRVNGGLVVDNDPGSVALGGVIEVFPDAASARARAEQLQRDALGIPPRAERGYLSGRVLLRLSPYLAEAQALEYRRALGAEPVPPASPPQDLRDA